MNLQLIHPDVCCPSCFFPVNLETPRQFWDIRWPFLGWWVYVIWTERTKRLDCMVTCNYIILFAAWHSCGSADLWRNHSAALPPAVALFWQALHEACSGFDSNELNHLEYNVSPVVLTCNPNHHQASGMTLHKTLDPVRALGLSRSRSFTSHQTQIRKLNHELQRHAASICAMVKSRIFLGTGNLPPLMTESL